MSITVTSVIDRVKRDTKDAYADAFGTVTATKDSVTIAGNSTKFTSEFSACDSIVIDGDGYVVKSVESGIALTLESAFLGDTASYSIKTDKDCRWSNLELLGLMMNGVEAIVASRPDSQYITDFDGTRVDADSIAFNVGATEIPLLSNFRECLSMYVLMFAYGKDAENAHYKAQVERTATMFNMELGR